MDYWKTPENPNAEAEHQRLNEELLQEVSLSVPTVSRPIEIDTNPVTSYPQISAQQSSIPHTVIPFQPEALSTNDVLHYEWVTVMALKKRYPGAPILPSQQDLIWVKRVKDLKLKFRNFSILLDQMLEIMLHL